MTLVNIAHALSVSINELFDDPPVNAEQVHGDSFGARLQYLREQLNMSQSDCCIEMEISHSMWSNYESNRGIPQPCRLYEMACFFGVRVSDMLGVT